MTLKEARLDKRLTQQQLADLVGVAQGSIKNYEMNVSTPSILLARKIAEALNLSIDEIDEFNFNNND